MKALTLWQPHAGLIAMGIKTIETRVWPTDYRGPLAIHAGKTFDGEYWEAATWHGYVPEGFHDDEPALIRVHGAIVCVVDLVDCRLMRPDDVWAACCDCPLPNERGKFAWILRDVRVCSPAIPCVGHQRFWECDLVDINGKKYEACLSPNPDPKPIADPRQMRIPGTE